MRPQEVQMREFEVCQHGMISPVIAFLIVQVLEKVKHENIVKLLAIEEEQEGRGKVCRCRVLITITIGDFGV